MPKIIFETYYGGANGKDGDGNIFCQDTILSFQKHVLASTGARGCT